MIDLPSCWPAGRTLAVSVNVMLEQWSASSAPGLGPMGNPLKPGVIDTQAQSWASYGPTTGAWRLLDVLDEMQVEAVFYVSGIAAEQYVELIRAIAVRKHAVAAHGWSQDVLPVYQTYEAERADLVRCKDAIERSSGVVPRGYISPRCTPSLATVGLLASQGFEWHADYFDADLPHMRVLPEGRIVAMPFTMEVNDLPLAIRYGNEPGAFLASLTAALEEGRRSKRSACIDITVHAHVYGRAASTGAFRKALHVAKEYGDTAWLTTHANLARAFSGP